MNNLQTLVHSNTHRAQAVGREVQRARCAIAHQALPAEYQDLLQRAAAFVIMAYAAYQFALTRSHGGSQPTATSADVNQFLDPNLTIFNAFLLSCKVGT